jgi:hypothetical protein
LGPFSYSALTPEITKGQIMSNIYVEQDDDGYAAYQNKKTIAKGDTQMQAAKRAHRESPDDPILAERVRNTDVGSRDKWRRIYP